MTTTGPADTPTPAEPPSRARRSRPAAATPDPAAPAPAVTETIPPAAAVGEPTTVREAPVDPVPPAGPGEHPSNGRRSLTIDLPLLTATVRAPQLPRVGRREVAETAGVVRSLLPPPGKMLFYGGLAALAALEIIEWPVAAVVAAGTFVAERSRGTERDRVRDGEPVTAV